MLTYNSDEEYDKILQIFSANELKSILHKDIAGALEIIANSIYAELGNIKNVNSDTYDYWDGKQWVKSDTDIFISNFYITVQKILKTVQKPIDYYMDLDNPRQQMLEDDPNQIMKHLDAFINKDDGYGWEVQKNVSREKITAHIIATLIPE